MLGGRDTCHAEVDLGEIADFDRVAVLRCSRLRLRLFLRRFGLGLRRGLGRQVFLAGFDHLVDGRLLDTAQQRFELGDFVAGQRRGQIGPGQIADLQERFGALGRLRQHRLEIDRELGEQVERGRADLLQLVLAAVFLGQLPGCALGDIGVGLVGQRHDLANRLGKAALLVVFGDLVGSGGEALEQLGLVQRIRQLAVEALGDEVRAAAGDVDVLAHQVRIDSGHEVVEVQVEILDLARQLGGEVVAQEFRRQMFQPGARLDEGAARLGHLLAVDGEKAVRMDRRGRAIAGAFQHGRPEQGMEIDDVLADEVVQLGVGIGLPEMVEVERLALGLAPLAQVGKARHIADRCIQPDIEILVFGARDLEAEIGRVAGDVPVLESGLEPFVELAGHGLLQMIAAGPVVQEGLEIGELEEIVFGVALDGRGAGQHRDRIDQFRRLVGRAADFAGIAILLCRAAFRAFASDEAIRQEHLFFFVVGLRDGATGDMTGLFQARVDLGGQLAVFVRMGRVVVVEADQEVVEILLVLGADVGNELLGFDAHVARLEHDRRAVRVVRADIDAVVAAQLLEAHPHVGLDVLHQMAEMDRPVGVGQGGGDKNIARHG